MARIYGVQKALASHPSADLINLENLLHHELDLILDQERDLWALKSRINWMIQGDRNTSFYHVSTIARRKRNHIASVKDNVGNWLTKDSQVMEFFRNGIAKLYTTSHLSAPWTAIISNHWRAQLSEEVKRGLEDVVSSEEIKHALLSMKPHQAPGPDGLHAGFNLMYLVFVGGIYCKGCVIVRENVKTQAIEARRVFAGISRLSIL